MNNTVRVIELFDLAGSALEADRSGTSNLGANLTLFSQFDHLEKLI